MKNIENEVNSKIRDGVPVTVDVVALDDPKLKTVFAAFNYIVCVAGF